MEILLQFIGGIFMLIVFVPFLMLLLSWVRLLVLAVNRFLAPKSKESDEYKYI